jgi:glycosyltransferase involved in cell wall biosynthesis
MAPSAYSVLARDPKAKGVGGSEVQQTILAREFARRGYKVSMVTWDVGQPDGIEIDGVLVCRAFARNAGLPKTRLTWGLIGKWRAMARANADLYYQQNCAVDTGYVAAFAKTHRRYSIYCGASDFDFQADIPYLNSNLTKRLYLYGLKNVSKIIAQSPRQVRDCREAFGLESEVIRSCYGHQGEPGKEAGVILWAGTVKPIKRPELFVDLARQCPELRFCLVGGGDDSYVKPLRELANGVDNIEFAGVVPYYEVEKYLDGASIVINTSITEGFPNTFLQAWSRGIPTVSFFDPDARIENRNVGSVVSSVKEMAAEVRRLKEDAAYWARAGKDCREYFLSNFVLNKIVDEYESLFDRMTWMRRKSK